MSSKFKSKRIAISYIVNEKDELLMGKRQDCQKWTTASGHIEEGEDAYVGMIRELKEETDLDVESIKLVKVVWEKHKKLLLYLFEIKTSGEVDASNDPDEEFGEIKFVDPIEVIDELHVPCEENIAIKYWFDN